VSDSIIHKNHQGNRVTLKFEWAGGEILGLGARMTTLDNDYT